jgi:acetyltransferase-like isoleucine patch superfamily enzyme
MLIAGGRMRIKKILTFPINFIWAKLSPVSYAKKIGVKINGNVTIYGSSYKMFSSEPFLVTLGDNVFISIDTNFVCHDGSTLPFRKNNPSLEIAGRINVGNNVFIGMKVIILPNVTIGNNCIIAAGSVVTKDIPDNFVAGGNPAKPIRNIDEYLTKIEKNSLGFGYLKGKEKEDAYKKHFSVDS